MFENIIYFAYDFNINVNKALVRELEGTACAYRCWKRHDDGLADISRPELNIYNIVVWIAQPAHFGIEQ